MQTLKVEPIEHIDVHNKTKFYLKISNDVDSYIITVGQRTIDECKRMQAMKPQTEVQFDNVEMQQNENGTVRVTRHTTTKVSGNGDKG